ncbi:sensor histidine kinase [Propionivibrio sp.]|uniref:sensor histidine kinase n=1 Tax=Propionivibrio sp. TaxID=2212460 RepID=UPI003BF1DE79
MIEQLYPYLILVGVTIGGVLFALRGKALRISRINVSLIRLNDQLDFDTLAFLRAAWALLAQAGLRGVSWKLDWFGISIEGQEGKQTGERVTREIEVKETRLVITLFQRVSRGEPRYFNEALAETFFLLLRTDMWIKAGAVQVAFMQMSKLNTFLQHDMKNIAQYIQLMSDQLVAVPAGRAPQVLDDLRTSVPLIRIRADRIVRTLKSRQPEDQPLRTYTLRDELAQLCRLHRLNCEISGDAEMLAPENTLDRAFDNILKNYADNARRDGSAKPTLLIEIAAIGEHLGIRLESPDALPVQQLERLFEPFWSSDAAGLGIGLYQARQALQSCGGTLTAELTESGHLRFNVGLPRMPV